jgi:hypothetical protein
VSDFDHENSVRREMSRRVGEDAAHEIQAVTSARERKPRLASVLRRQSSHRGRGDVRGIGEDHVVAPAIEGRKEVGLDEAHPTLQPVIAHVALCHIESRARNIGGVHACAREFQCSENRETA